MDPNTNPFNPGAGTPPPELVDKTTTQSGPVRDSLIRKGMIFSPVHGDSASTVPLFDQFMKRTTPMPTKVKRSRR